MGTVVTLFNAVEENQEIIHRRWNIWGTMGTVVTLFNAMEENQEDYTLKVEYLGDNGDFWDIIQRCGRESGRLYTENGIFGGQWGLL